MGKGDRDRTSNKEKFRDSYKKIFGEKPVFTGRVSLEKIEDKRTDKSPDVVFAGTSWPDKEIEIKRRQRNALEKDPLHITLEDKRRRAMENQDTQREYIEQQRKYYTGQVSDV